MQRQIETSSIHVIVEGNAKPLAEKLRIAAGKRLELYVITGESPKGRLRDTATVLGGVQPHRTMCCHGKTMPKSGLDQP